MSQFINFDDLDWSHPTGQMFKPTYAESGDWALSAADREAESVRRIRKYLETVTTRKPMEKAA